MAPVGPIPMSDRPEIFTLTSRAIRDPTMLLNLSFDILFQIPEDEYKSMVKANGVEEGEAGQQIKFFTRRITERNQALNEHTFMVRKPYVETLQYLRQIDWAQQDNLRFVLWGKLGTGKSITLSQIHHFAFNSNFMVVNFHDIRNMLSNNKESVESSYKKNRWDFPVETKALLTEFQYYNQDKMDGLVTHKEYKWSDMESSEPGVPLSDIIDLGLARPRFAADCFNVLLKELKLNIQKGWNKHPLMVIVDGINVIFQERTFVTKTMSRRKNHKTIDSRFLKVMACSPDELSLIVAIKHLLRPDYKNSCVVSSVDHNLNMNLDRPRTRPKPRHHHNHWWQRKSFQMGPDIDAVDYPFDLLGNHGWEHMHPFIPIETGNYDREEMDAMIDYYVDKR